MSDRSHRRKLGQNYLVDPVILFEMERAINPQEKNLFFEIGPGTGALTNHLMGNNIQIIAMDLDAKNVKRFVSLIERSFNGHTKEEILNINGSLFLESIGLGSAISSQRTNGFSNAIHKIQNELLD